MRSNRILGIAAAVTLTVAVASAAVVWAQTPGPRGRWRSGLRHVMALNFAARQLSLTADQKQQIKDIVRNRKDDIRALVDQSFAARKALRHAVAGGNSDEIAAAAGSVAAAQLKAAQLRADLRAKIFSQVLQPDQRSKADALLAKWDEKADQRRQRIDQFLDGM